MPKSPRNREKATLVTRAFLRTSPLPVIEHDDDKESRGRVLVVGGEVAIPGAVVLAGIAALRAGAGKLQIATCRSIAPNIGIAVPEALALGLDETRDGTVAVSAVAELRHLTENADAILVGPGMTVGDDNTRFVSRLLLECAGTPTIIDAGALGVLQSSPDALAPFGGNAVITPHAGEMAAILGIAKKEIDLDPVPIAVKASRQLGCVVALKGSRTWIASPDGDLFCYDSGDVGLATSGSGDTLAGIVAGLMARSCDPLNAALWGVFLHGAAGNMLAKRIGRVGYLARELLDEIPPIMNDIQSQH